MKTLNEYLMLSYRMEIVEDRDEGGFVVSYPELPGCMTVGETIEEGQIWEAAMFAGAKHVDNLIATIDYNHQQIDGTTMQVMDLGNLKAKFEAFMWTVVEIENGNDMQQVLDGMAKAKALTGKGSPVCVILKTEMGYGVDFMQGINKYHGAVVSADDLPKALAQLPETELGDF